MTAGVSAQGYVIAAFVSLLASAAIAVLVALVLSACFPARSRRPSPVDSGSGSTTSTGPAWPRGRRRRAANALVSLGATVVLVAVVLALVDRGDEVTRVGASDDAPPAGAPTTTTTLAPPPPAPVAEPSGPDRTRTASPAPSTNGADAVEDVPAPYLPDPHAALTVPPPTTAPRQSLVSPAVPSPPPTAAPARPPSGARTTPTMPGPGAPTTVPPRELRLPFLVPPPG